MYDKKIQELEKIYNTVKQLPSRAKRRMGFLTGIRHVYLKPIPVKGIYEQMFNSSLYYRNGIYRARTILNSSLHNYFGNKWKGFYIQKRGSSL